LGLSSLDQPAQGSREIVAIWPDALYIEHLISQPDGATMQLVRLVDEVLCVTAAHLLIGSHLSQPFLGVFPDRVQQ